ncbi:alpha-glucosidase [Clostridium sp. 19966]|uniref:glycoside hydrolase family 13 protein n=1 Tax=Clostridium sp. 19966 TaxID=2768166 RepID=UPI0028DE6C7C|nr:alpha-glucosidase [Clostridium sp. 19966]MDT8715626.1 alpha-glucosidase [Clostridium sp. 19966]
MVNKEGQWWRESIAYQIYPRSFYDSNGDGIGDIRGIIDKLDYLKDLGINLIWICPIYKSPNDDNGYDISDYRSIQEEFGTMEDFDELLEKAHARGINIIMDLVINHTSDEHQWFIESRSSKDNPKRDWYIWKDGKDGLPPNNWASIFGGSAWEYDEKTNQYYLHVFSQKMPDINWENADARNHLYDMICWWLDKGIDGFRVDAISHIKKNDYSDMPNPDNLEYVQSFDKHMNQKGIQEFLLELSEKTFKPYNVFSIAEASGVHSDEMEEWISTKKGKFSCIFQFEHQHLWNMNNVEKHSFIEFKEALSKWQYATEEDGWIALFLENHDLIRSINKFGDADKYWKESAKCLALMYFMQKGIPFIYQGQEIGMVNADYDSVYEFKDAPSIYVYEERITQGMDEKKSLDIMKATTRDNSRTPMQWNNDTNGGFSNGIPWMKVNKNYRYINAEQQKKDKDSILSFYKAMIGIRKNHKTLIYGKYKLLMEDSESIFAYERKDEKGIYLIACNLSKKEQILEVPYDLSHGQLLLKNYDKINEENQYVLKPYEARLYMLELQ